jgi:hypothetical protein
VPLVFTVSQIPSAPFWVLCSGGALLGWVQNRQGHDTVFPFKVVLWLSVIPGLLAVLSFFILVTDPEHTASTSFNFAPPYRVSVRSTMLQSFMG